MLYIKKNLNLKSTCYLSKENQKLHLWIDAKGNQSHLQDVLDASVHPQRTFWYISRSGRHSQLIVLNLVSLFSWGVLLSFMAPVGSSTHSLLRSELVLTNHLIIQCYPSFHFNEIYENYHYNKLNCFMCIPLIKYNLFNV